jgi:hypothetical protein
MSFNTGLNTARLRGLPCYLAAISGPASCSWTHVPFGPRQCSSAPRSSRTSTSNRESTALAGVDSRFRGNDARPSVSPPSRPAGGVQWIPPVVAGRE